MSGVNYDSLAFAFKNKETILSELVGFKLIHLCRQWTIITSNNYFVKTSVDIKGKV